VDHELEVIRGQMEATRESLSDKLGELESQVREGVQVANETVAATVGGVKDAVSSVKETVSETVETVKETFNIRQHIEDHPWAAFGTAVAVGVAGGMFLTPSRVTAATAAAEKFINPPSPAPATSSTNEPGVMSSLLENFKGLALGSLLGIARDLVSQKAPPAWHEALSDVLDDVSMQLTGEKHPKSLLPLSTDENGAQDRSSGEPGSTGSAARGTNWASLHSQR